jgi:hypothetical protein
MIASGKAEELIVTYVHPLFLKAHSAASKADNPSWCGEKKSALLAKHNDTNIPTMMEPFSSSATWF